MLKRNSFRLGKIFRIEYEEGLKPSLFVETLSYVAKKDAREKIALTLILGDKSFRRLLSRLLKNQDVRQIVESALINERRRKKR